MSQIFVRPNVYEFLCEGRGRWEKRIYIKAECGPGRYSGEGYVKFWIEIHHPEKYNHEDAVFVPASVDTSPYKWIDSYDYVHTKNKTWAKSEAKWLIREMIIVLGRGGMPEESAGDLVWTVFHYTQVRTKAKWLQEWAPEWWARMEPDSKALA